MPRSRRLWLHIMRGTPHAMTWLRPVSWPRRTRVLPRSCLRSRRCWLRPRTGCGDCSCPATLMTTARSFSRSRLARAGRSRRCSPATCCGCTCGMPRVQRVPVTESQGRIHTSAAGVLVMPEVDDVEVMIDTNDLKVDVYRSSGPGGQSVNTTDSAVRITHLPTGTVVSCQNEKSQLQNKESAMRVLRARLHQLAQDEADAVASAQRKSQIRTVDRSERIRTYNYPENRIADHRTGYKAYNLDVVLDGDLDPVVQSAVDTDDAARMAAVADGSGSVTSGSVTSLREAVRDAVRALSDAGIDSAEFDAMALAAAALGTTPSEVHKLMIMGAPIPQGFDDLVAERARRVPLQHLTGRAGFRHQMVEP